MGSMNKIDRPPTVENWSRFQQPDINSTARKIFSFLKGGPRWGYQPSRKVVQYHFEDGIDRETGHKVIAQAGSPLGRFYNSELVDSFFDHVEAHPIKGIAAFSEFSTAFPISREIAIPVKRIAVVRDEGKFCPIFLCPWSSIGFDKFQSSLFMTVLESSVFTLTDFQDANGKVLFFPKQEVSKGVFKRKAVVWSRGDKQLLSKGELEEQIQIFAKSKDLARVWYADFLKRKNDS